jgi:hypothetical protein
MCMAHENIMIGVVHIPMVIALLLVKALNAFGITQIAGHTLTTAYLCGLSAAGVLNMLAVALGVSLVPLGNITPDKALQLLRLFATQSPTAISQASSNGGIQNSLTMLLQQIVQSNANWK